ncbi:hypothetical protein JBL43_16570 [Aureibaculum sp. A20]|uniref:Uncharacterized protein n=1 Tax=Aureibaculum flavum TaxID=2795986 RepID=A0ABS0WVA8_9FLAO|nr:hypothetical protein [Aureibaculum flavum]MBJ2175870.1 hypothetical protein [Aureibaculum flavum]
MELIKRYRKQKLIQLLIGSLALVVIYFFIDISSIHLILIAFVFILSIGYSTKLLTQIKIEDETYTFETYSIVTKKEEIKIHKSELSEILYKPDFLFNSHNLILKHCGTNGIIVKNYI